MERVLEAARQTRLATRTTSLATVLCGTFHRSPDQLVQTFDALSASFRVLSPTSVSWVDPSDAFVRLAGQAHQPVGQIEHAHLDAIRSADFVWLFCPDGYVGTSAAMEIGYAHASGVPILTDNVPNDFVVASMVTVVEGGVESAADAVAPIPGHPLGALQRYYQRIAERRGWSGESPSDVLLLITEEIGELARALRVNAGLSRDGRPPESSVDEELADVQLYLVHLANAIGVDLASAVTAKELINVQRNQERDNAA